MKPCKLCKEPKTAHNAWRGISDHRYEPDNLAYLERVVKLKEAREKHHKLNFCQICQQVKKTPFGICKECSEQIISAKLSYENRDTSKVNEYH